jgi:hypothetical protein
MTDNLHDERRARVRMEILIALERVSGRMLAENILFADSNLRLSPRATLSEFRTELSSLEQMGLVVIARDDFSGRQMIKITGAGITELAAQQS